MHPGCAQGRLPLGSVLRHEQISKFRARPRSLRLPDERSAATAADGCQPLQAVPCRLRQEDRFPVVAYLAQREPWTPQTHGALPRTPAGGVAPDFLQIVAQPHRMAVAPSAHLHRGWRSGFGISSGFWRSSSSEKARTVSLRECDSGKTLWSTARSEEAGRQANLIPCR